MPAKNRLGPHNRAHKGNKAFELPSLFFESRKNELEGGFLRISKQAQLLFQEVSKLSTNDFILPKCVDTHIGAAINKAASLLHWHPDVIWVAHALRHSAFSTLEQGITEAVDNYVTQVASSTFRNTYAKSMSHRTK